MKKIAVVDDDLEMGRLVKDVLSYEGYSVSQYASASEALVRFKTDLPDILITDLKMKDIDGMMLLRKMQTDHPGVVTVMMTGFGSIETAVEAMKNGAYHYIVKPFKNEELVFVVKRAAEQSRLLSENKLLRQELNKSFNLENIVGKSAPMKDLFELIKTVAPASANILITGESGTGKEIVARAIHNLGARSKKLFVPVNVTAIPSDLIESELFGHVKGSFTGAIADKKGLFEEADGGTLFLDEIGDLSVTLQAKLLRVLQDRQIRRVGGNELKKIDVRIIAATHRNLQEMVADGTFREDLFYRLNVIPVKVPPLRDRIEDVPFLAQHFIEKFSAQNGSKVKNISSDAISHLMTHRWPGNVRELENIMERAVVMCRQNEITGEDILGTVVHSHQNTIERLMNDTPTLDVLEERYIKLILEKVHNQKEEASRVLGISRRTLYRKEKTYGMVPHDAPEPFEDALSVQ
jgi:DNA-binding NtrC family response regulator